MTAPVVRRGWTFRAVTPLTDWLRADMEEVHVEDARTAFLLHLIYRGAGIHYTVERVR